RYQGMLAASVDEAVTCFATASDLHGLVNQPFERARTLLCEGQTMRRWRQIDRARIALHDSAAAFAALGAVAWRDQASRELAAAGIRERAPARSVSPVQTLTTMELQIARLVAGGRNNADVAAAAFVTVKTVESHLTRVYRKLGIGSRSQLT